MKILTLYSPNIFVIHEKIDIGKLLMDFDQVGTLFVVTPSVYEKLSFLPKRGKLAGVFSFHQEDLDKEILDLVDTSRIIAIGASKVLDRAKYIASKLKVPLSVFPSILSTNAFSTERSVLKVKGKATSLISKAPDSVYIVDSLLDMAPKGYNRFGLIDVFSIYTALADWDIAVSKGKATLALEYYFAKSILDTCLYSNLDMENYYDVVKLLWHSGLVVGMYGDGRPESGSEHIIAKAIESKIDCFHVHSVSFGMLVAMKLQGTWREDIVKLIVDISDWGSEYGKQTLKQIEDHLLSEDIHFRLGRYTVLDMVDGVRIQNMINEVIEYLRHDLRL